MKDLTSLNKQELASFFNSFDLVLCDVHGVLWNIIGPIPGTPQAVKSLQNLGKRFVIVSNNTTVTIDDFLQEFKSSGFELTNDDIVIPTSVIISYLEERAMGKKIFVIGTPALKKSLEDTGFQIVPDEPYRNYKTLEEYGRVITTVDDDVVAVVEDFDYNINYVQLQKAVTLLRRSNVVFIKGAGDNIMNLDSDTLLIGPGMFHKMLEEITGRVPVSVAKPGSVLNQFIVEKYQIQEPSRVLFIGDSIQSDMGFAGKFGYQKLLVLTGLAKEESLGNWNWPEEFKPDFYIDSLSSMCQLI